jgi:hypothetical protein
MPAPAEAESSIRGGVYFRFQLTTASQTRAKQTQSTDRSGALPVAVNASDTSVFDISRVTAL